MRVTKKALVSLPLLLALVAPALPVAAQDETDPNAAKMSLADCLTRALENNLALRILKLDPDVARHSVTFQDAVFDPVLGASATYGDSTASTTLNGVALPEDNSSNFWRANASVSQLTKIGASYQVGANYFNSSDKSFFLNSQNGFFTRSESDSDSLNPFATFTLPLLKNFGKEVNTFLLVRAENDVKISDEQLKRNADVTLKSVGDAYWDVAAARAAVNVSKQSLKLAQDLFDLNKKKVEVGTLAPIEITQAEAGVASREEGVIVAENLLRDTEDNLRRLMAVPPDDAIWNHPIITTEEPKAEPTAIDLDAAIATALQERAEVRNAKTQLETDKLGAKVAQKQTRHELNLVANLDATYGDQTSRSVIINPPGVPPTSDKFGSDTFPNWSVGLIYAYPFGNRAAKANAAIAKINEERSQIGVEIAEQDVRVDVRTAARAVESGAKRVAAAHSNTILQQKTVDAELKKFENGMSTSFEVLRIQTDLADAQVAEIRAVLDYNKALADLERAKGTLLASKGMKLETSGGK